MKKTLLFCMLSASVFVFGCNFPTQHDQNGSSSGTLQTTGFSIITGEKITGENQSDIHRPNIVINGQVKNIENLTTEDQHFSFGPTGDSVVISGENVITVSGDTYTFFDTFSLRIPSKPAYWYWDRGLKQIGITHSTSGASATLGIATNKFDINLFNRCNEVFREGFLVSKKKEILNINGNKITSVFIATKYNSNKEKTRFTGKTCFKAENILYNISLYYFNSFDSMKEIIGTLQFVK